MSGRNLASSTRIPASLNFSLALMHLVLNIYLLFLLPLYLLPLSPWWGLTLFLVAGLSNLFWSIIHEAIHDLFHPSYRINRAAGRLLAIFFGSPFRVLRASHLMHHSLNRSPLEGTELYDPEKVSRFRASFGYYFQILGGLYLLEVISTLLFLLPRNLLRLLERRYFCLDDLSGRLVRSLLKERSIREIRADGLLVLGLFGLSAFSYGAHWELLLAAMLLRGFLISFLDNVYHYQTPVNEVSYAMNLWLPPLFSSALLHFNLHGIHHRDPTIPWIGLPDVFRAQWKVFDATYSAAALRQLSGPVALSDL